MSAIGRSVRERGRRLGVILAAVALSGVFVVAAAGPAAAAAGVTLSQQYGLTDGQSISVSGSGFGASASLNLLQCTNAGPPCTTGVPVTADPSGAFGPVSFTVQQTIGAADCTTQGCVVVASESPTVFDASEISFGAAPTTPMLFVIPSTNLTDPATVDVYGQGWIGYHQISVGQCRSDGQCAPFTQTFTNGNGTFGPLAVEVHLTFTATPSGIPVDCALSQCVIGAGQSPTINAGANIDFNAGGATITGTVRDELGTTYTSAGALACPGTTPAVYGCVGMKFVFGGGAYTLSGLLPNSDYSVVGFAQVVPGGAFFGAPPVALTTPGLGETTSGVDFVFDSTLSGTVTGPDGFTPVEGATVNLVQPTGSGTIALTDAAGAFTSPLIPAGEFLIEVVPPPGSGLGPTTRPVTIGVNSDVNYGFQLGLGAEIQASVLDNGSPIPGAGFGFCTYPATGPSCPGLRFAYTDGSGNAVIAGIAAGTYNVAGFTDAGLTITPNVVVTVSGGDVVACAFTFNPTSASCSGGSPDADGVSGAVEDGAPNGGDGNNDGIPDSQQSNVTSLPNAVNGGYVTVASPGTTTLSNVAASAIPPSAPPLPAGTTAPIGLVNFVVQGVTVGGGVDVTLHLPPGTSPNSYLKLHAGAWVDFTPNVTISGDTVTLHLVDGGAGDADGVPNGEIVDPGAPTVRVLTPSSKDDCKKGGWKSFTDDGGRPFANQGDCVSFMATKGKNTAKG